MDKPYLLGIDIGTSACKVAVFDREGQVMASGSGDYPVYYPKEGWAEQDPEEWWTAVCGAIQKLCIKGAFLRSRSPEWASTDRAGRPSPSIKNGEGPCQHADLDGYQSPVDLRPAE